LCGAVTQIECRAFVRSLLWHLTVCREALLLVGLLMEFVECGINGTALEMSILKEGDPFGAQAPCSCTVTIRLHKLAVLLGVAGLLNARLINSNREMSATNIVSRERRQVRVNRR